MKKLNKMLAVVLALVMCAGMIVPAFAANFTELQEAIDSTEDGIFGEKEDISAYTDEDGVRNVTLLDNVTREDGEETIAVMGVDVTLNLDGHDIDAQGKGGVLAVAGADLTINGADEDGNEGSIKGGNSVDTGYGSYDTGYGGGLDIMYSDVELNNVKVTGNTAQYGGGGLRVQEGSTVTINGGEISGNTADYAGGISVIGDEWDTSTITIDGSKITGNTAKGDGSDQHSGNGGGIIVEVNSTAAISNTEFADNTASNAGGAINIYDDASATITDSNIHDNHANGNHGGGAIIVDGKDDPDGASATIKNTTMTDNTAAQNGGAINAKNANVTISDSTISGNEAGENGGGILAENVQLNVSNSNVSNNDAEASGDDIVGVNGTTLTMADDQSIGGTLKDDKQKIDGWYQDNSGNRWSSDTYTKVGTAYDGAEDFALKAAHGEIPSDPAPEIPDPEVPLGPGPDETEIDEPEVPLAGAEGLNDLDHMAYIIGYEDDTVRPLDNITRAEVATIFFRLMTDLYRTINWSTTNDFIDVNEGDWFNNAVSTCANAGIVDGYADGTFLPNKAVTRAEFAAIVARFLGDEYTGEGIEDFSDTADHWAAGEIRRCVEAGWVTTGEDAFRPEDLITRAEVMTIINRMLHRTPDEDHMIPTMKTWIDNPKGTDYYEAVQEATNEHEYERDEADIETWTGLLEMRDWEALEAQWAAEMAG